MNTPTPVFELTPKARTFATPWEEPAVVQAASITMSLLRKTKTDSLTALNTAILARDQAVLKALASVNLTVRQRSLLTEFARPLSMLRHNPNTHLLHCASCGADTLIAASAPSKCQITLGCLSKDLHKSTFAKYVPDGEPLPEAENHPYQPVADEPDETDDADDEDEWVDLDDEDATPTASTDDSADDWGDFAAATDDDWSDQW